MKKGGRPVIEIMIPLTITQPELTMARGWCQQAIDDAQKSTKKKLDVTIGTMIETPRACIRADDIAIEADFFSFGTNDLTQMTLGFSRDDVEGRMMEAYLEYGLLKRNPFETLDDHGVGELVRLGTKRGPRHQAELEARDLWRTRWRSRIDPDLLRRGPRLRVVFAVPGADRPTRRRTGGARPQLIVRALNERLLAT